VARQSLTTEMGRVVESLDNQLMATLQSSRKFTLVDRGSLDTLMANLKSQKKSLFDEPPPPPEGVDYCAFIKVDHFQEETARANIGGTEKVRRTFQVSAQVKIVKAAVKKDGDRLGEILDMSSISTQVEDVGNVTPGSNRPTGLTDKLMPELAKKLAEKSAARLLAVVFPAKIIDVDEGVLTINQGEAFFKKGDVVQVFGPARVKEDPDTGEMIRIPGKVMGTAKITSVTPTISQAKMNGKAEAVEGALVQKVDDDED